MFQNHANECYSKGLSFEKEGKLEKAAIAYASGVRHFDAHLEYTNRQNRSNHHSRPPRDSSVSSSLFSSLFGMFGSNSNHLEQEGDEKKCQDALIRLSQKTDPFNIIANYQLATKYQQSKKWMLAKTLYEKLAYECNHAASWYSLGILYQDHRVEVNNILVTKTIKKSVANNAYYRRGKLITIPEYKTETIENKTVEKEEVVIYKNIDSEYSCYYESARRGSKPAMSKLLESSGTLGVAAYYLAQVYEPMNVVRAVEYYTQASNLGDKRADSKLQELSIKISEDVYKLEAIGYFFYSTDDPDKASLWYEKAIKKDKRTILKFLNNEGKTSSIAAVILVMLYEKGCIHDNDKEMMLSQDYKQAVVNCINAANKNYLKAIVVIERLYGKITHELAYSIAVMYESKEKMKDATRWYKSAVEKGSVDGLGFFIKIIPTDIDNDELALIMGEIHEFGLKDDLKHEYVMNPDYDKAAQYYLISNKINISSVYHYQRYSFTQNRNFSNLSIRLKRLFRMIKDDQIKCSIGDLFELNGYHSEAIKWYQSAAVNDFQPALDYLAGQSKSDPLLAYYMGVLYGEGIYYHEQDRRDNCKSKSWFFSSDSDDQEDFFNVYYSPSRRQAKVKQDNLKGYMFFYIASKSKYYDSNKKVQEIAKKMTTGNDAYQVGRIHYNCDDKISAVKWFQLAINLGNTKVIDFVIKEADKGDGYCAFIVGSLYEKGSPNIYKKTIVFKKDINRSARYYLIAAKQHLPENDPYEKLKQNLGHITDDELEFRIAELFSDAKDLIHARAWYHSSAQKGNVNAFRHFAKMANQGVSDPDFPLELLIDRIHDHQLEYDIAFKHKTKNPKLSCAYYKLSAKKGNKLALNELIKLARTYQTDALACLESFVTFNANDDILSILINAAALGHACAAFALANVYYHSSMAEKKAIAPRYYLDAAQKGYAPALLAIDQLFGSITDDEFEFSVANMYYKRQDNSKAMKWLKSSIEKGNTRALDFLNQAVAMNDPEAHFTLATLYENGCLNIKTGQEIVAISNGKAKENYLIAAKVQHRGALLALEKRDEIVVNHLEHIIAQMYFQENITQSIYWYKMALQNGDTAIFYDLCEKANKIEALKQTKNAELMFPLGELCEQHGHLYAASVYYVVVMMKNQLDANDVSKKMHALAETSADAQYALAYYYKYLSKSSDQYVPIAINYLIRAAQSGYQMAIDVLNGNDFDFYDIGQVYESGANAFSANQDMAIQYYIKAEEKERYTGGHHKAMLRLAQLFSQESSRKDLNKSYQIYIYLLKNTKGLFIADAIRGIKELAEKNHCAAQHQMGLLNEEGEGIPYDHLGAMNWYTKAALQQHTPAFASLIHLGSKYPPAFFELAKIYEAEFNVAKAIQYYHMAANKNHAGAKESLLRLEKPKPLKEKQRATSNRVEEKSSSSTDCRSMNSSTASKKAANTSTDSMATTSWPLYKTSSTHNVALPGTMCEMMGISEDELMAELEKYPEDAREALKGIFTLSPAEAVEYTEEILKDNPSTIPPAQIMEMMFDFKCNRMFK